ncbi:MAG: hypothetical protein LBV67_00290 [Streptococcaceae bacterium]|jgi:Tfp pilus assembly protein PilX|nr:hypothetical protein [Streptococcaceae bacterium]
MSRGNMMNAGLSKGAILIGILILLVVLTILALTIYNTLQIRKLNTPAIPEKKLTPQEEIALLKSQVAKLTKEKESPQEVIETLEETKE